MTTDEPTDAEKLRILWDIEQIKQLKARYFLAVDGQDFETLASLFTEDASSFDAIVMEGVTDRHGFAKRAQERLISGVSVHQGHMPLITITGPDTATGVWSMYDYIERGAPTVDGSRDGMHGYGYYHEEYRKVPGVGWRIEKWKLSRIRVDPL